MIGTEWNKRNEMGRNGQSNSRAESATNNLDADSENRGNSGANTGQCSERAVDASTTAAAELRLVQILPLWLELLLLLLLPLPLSKQLSSVASSVLFVAGTVAPVDAHDDWGCGYDDGSDTDVAVTVVPAIAAVANGSMSSATFPMSFN